jgi:hypothetical protein
VIENLVLPEFTVFFGVAALNRLAIRVRDNQNTPVQRPRRTITPTTAKPALVGDPDSPALCFHEISGERYIFITFTNVHLIHPLNQFHVFKFPRTRLGQRVSDAS